MSERIIELTMHELESVVGGVGHEHGSGQFDDQRKLGLAAGRRLFWCSVFEFRSGVVPHRLSLLSDLRALLVQILQHLC